MKRFLLVIATIAGLVSPVSAGDWQGFYIGGQFGHGRGDNDHAFVFLGTPGEVDFGIKGFSGGGTIGYNVQVNPNWVLGVESDFSLADIKGSAPDSATYGCAPICETRVDSFGTLRARLGYALNNVLFYGTGGYAFGRVNARDQNCTLGNCGTPSVHGWAAGGGIEWAFTGGWSAKLEYLRVDFNRAIFQDSPAVNCGLADGGCTVEAKFDTIRIGLNYRFGSGQ